MVYDANVFKFLFSKKDHMLKMREAEVVKGVWKMSAILVLLSMLIYGWMAYLGMGSDHISSQATALSAIEYEQSKFWFLVGRVCFGLLLSLFLLFIVPFILYGLTEIPFKKLVIMQQLVLCVLLVERIIWIPLFVFAGLDWYVSPLSFGIIASYITDIPWIISFFGAISLFQLWIIWFQVTYIHSLSSMKKQSIWASIILLHVFYWLMVAFLVYFDTSLLGGWSH